MSDEESAGNRLPPFPVDDATLDLLWLAMFPPSEAEAQSSSVGTFLNMMDQLGGSDPFAVARQIDDHTYLMRDESYHEHNVMAALITEIRRLRADASAIRVRTWDEAVQALRDEDRYLNWAVIDDRTPYSPTSRRHFALYLEDHAAGSEEKGEGK